MLDESLNNHDSKSWLYHPVFPHHWERAQLYSLARWVNGIVFREIQFSKNGKPVIKIAEIKGGITGQTKFTEQVFDESVRVRTGDLLFSWSGQPETSIDVFWWRGPEGWLNQHSFRVTPVAEIDPTFFFYIMRYLKPSFIGIARNKQTTGLGHVTKLDLEKIEVAFPGNPEQQTIAHILGTLDDKIELNRRMIATLEEMARALFKSWFIDFDPVHAKAQGRPTSLPPEIEALFPDSFEDSELGPIPLGWSATEFGEVSSVFDSKRVPLASRVRAERQGPYPYYGATSVMDYVDSFIFEGVYLLMGEDGSVIKPDGTPFLQYVWGQFWVNNHAHIIQGTNGISTEHLMVHLMHSNIGAYITGAVQLKLNQGNMNRIPFIHPGEKVAVAYNACIQGHFTRIRKLSDETKCLELIRDSLLPKLMSGELRIPIFGEVNYDPLAVGASHV